MLFCCISIYTYIRMKPMKRQKAMVLVEKIRHSWQITVLGISGIRRRRIGWKMREMVRTFHRIYYILACADIGTTPVSYCSPYVGLALCVQLYCSTHHCTNLLYLCTYHCTYHCAHHCTMYTRMLYHCILRSYICCANNEYNRWKDEPYANG